jgi:2-methylisocitrate lyase-like PEP mutase family enzyme
MKRGNMTKQSTVLRELLNAEELLVSIWGGTAHHAQLAETCGFKAFGVSGSLTTDRTNKRHFIAGPTGVQP